MQWGDNMKKYSGVIVCCMIFVLSLIVCSVGVKISNDNLAKSEQAKQQIENQISVLESDIQTNSNAAVSKVSGLSTARMSSDIDTIEEFAESMFTWNTLSGYDKNRELAISKYGVDGDGTFIKNFFTPITDKELKRIFNDNGYSMKYESVDAYVTKIGIDKYSYLCVVCVDMMKGSSELVSDLVLTCDVDVKGNMSDIAGYPLASDNVDGL